MKNVFCREVEIITSDSKEEVIRKMKEVVDILYGKEEKKHYEGDFCENKFAIVPKSASYASPGICFYGKFENSIDRKETKILIKVEYSTSVKVVICVGTFILGLKIFQTFKYLADDRYIFLGLLIFLWSFFLFSLKFQTKKFKEMIEKALV